MRNCVLFVGMWLNLVAISIILLPIMLGRWRANRDGILTPGLLPLLNSVGWLPLDRLFNGPHIEGLYLPGRLLTLGLILCPVAAGIIAGRPIASTLQTGGSLISDQWPCFMGVPNCD